MRNKHIAWGLYAAALAAFGIAALPNTDVALFIAGAGALLASLFLANKY